MHKTAIAIRVNRGSEANVNYSGGRSNWSATRELKIITTLVRYPFTPSDQKDVSDLFDAGFDLEIVLHLLRFHRLTIHAARNLNILKKKDLPKEFRYRVARQAAYAERYTQEQVKEMGLILDAFSAAEIEIMPIKGPATAMRCYSDPVRRMLHDIDLMTRSEDTERAIRLMHKLGFIQPKTAIREGFDSVDILRLQKWGSNIGFIHADRNEVLIELHWRPGRYFHEFPFYDHELWGGSETQKISDHITPSLNPVHEFLFLCSHGCKHEWKRLHWLLDIATIVQSGNVDLDDAFTLAAERGIEKPAALAIYLAHRLFGSDLPLDVATFMRSSASLNNYAEAIMRRRFSNAPQNDNAFKEACMEWRTAGLYGDRVKSITANFTPGPDDWNWVKLPKYLSGLYYPVRLFRILFEIAKSVIPNRH